MSRSLTCDPVGEGTRPSWGAMIGAACLPAAVSYFAVAAALAMITAAGGADSSATGVARVGAVGWLAAHHVPLTIDGAPLSVLPLLPTLLLGALVARGAARVAARTGIHQPADAGWVAGVIAGTHGVLGVVLTLAATPATVTADPGQAAVGCALVAGAAAGLGLARPCGLLPAALRQAPGWVRPGLMAGLWGLAVLLSAGFATVLIALVISAPEVAQASGTDAGSIFGLTVLSVGYLPNAVIAALSWLAGPGLSIGALSISPLAVHPGPVPAVPLLAALPQGPVQPWWLVVLVVPLLVGVAVGRRCAAAEPALPRRLRVLGVAAAVVSLGSAVLGALAGGRLGAAAFDPVEVPFGTLAVAVLAATLLGGCAALLLPSPAAATEPSASDVSDDPDQHDPEPAELTTTAID
ncbi:MAG: DUF6350 family protein [Pseudonocardiaceae bacterium]